MQKSILMLLILCPFSAMAHVWPLAFMKARQQSVDQVYFRKIPLSQLRCIGVITYQGRSMALMRHQQANHFLRLGSLVGDQVWLLAKIHYPVLSFVQADKTWRLRCTGAQ